MSDSNEEDRHPLVDSRRLDPRNNADDAYTVFMAMDESQWQGLLRSLLGGGCLQEEEGKGFKRALAERKMSMESQQMRDRHLGESIAATYEQAPAIPDYSADEPVPQSVDIIRQLGKLAAQQGLLELEIEDLEAQIKLKKKEHARYAEQLVPDLLAQIGLKSVTTNGGLQVELKEDVRASIPQDPVKRERAFSYLHDTGNDGMIKREITIRYGRDDGKFADDLLKKLEEMNVKEHGTVEHEWTIHNSTLVSFIKSELKEGRNIPLDAFGAFVQKHAKLRRK